MSLLCNEQEVDDAVIQRSELCTMRNVSHFTRPDRGLGNTAYSYGCLQSTGSDTWDKIKKQHRITMGKHKQWEYFSFISKYINLYVEIKLIFSLQCWLGSTISDSLI